MSQTDDYTKWHQSQPDVGLDEAVERIERKGKAILVMDMTETCGDCDIVMKLPHGGVFEHYCPKLACAVNPYDRPAACPLVEAIGYIQPVGNLVSWEDEE